MAGERFDELIPFRPVFWWSDVLLVPKRVQGVGIGSQLLGHEAEFDDGAHSVFKQAVVNLVDVGEVVDGLAGGVFAVDAYFIVKTGVEAYVFVVGDALGFAEVVAVAF